MRNMMSQVRNYSLIALLLVVLMGCEKKDPVETQQDVENPNWKITVDTTDMTASMTAIVKVSFTSQPGTLAAFMGNDCCGIAEYKADYGLYWLYISPAKETTNVQLKFYSPNQKRIYKAKETFPFVNNKHLGTISDPYILRY